MKRIIKQISAVEDKEGSAVCALCDDGTLWVYKGNGIHSEDNWYRFPDIPQSKELE